MVSLSVKCGIAAVVSCIVSLVYAYYDSFTCFGTGDCILNTGGQEGGMRDAAHKWNVECHDGEAIVGMEDTFNVDFEQISDVWCKFSFPHKQPSGGYYPYYPHCHVRNMTEDQYTCFDKKNPEETIHTFMTGMWDDVDVEGCFMPLLYKCCRTPPGYYLDYSKCYYKFTHDKYGEHYDVGHWLVKCDSNFLASGLGWAINPWDQELHYVWMQCCPYAYQPPAAEGPHVGGYGAIEQQPSYGQPAYGGDLQHRAYAPQQAVSYAQRPTES